MLVEALIVLDGCDPETCDNSTIYANIQQCSTIWGIHRHDVHGKHRHLDVSNWGANDRTYYAFGDEAYTRILVEWCPILRHMIWHILMTVEEKYQSYNIEDYLGMSLEQGITKEQGITNMIASFGAQSWRAMLVIPERGYHWQHRSDDKEQWRNAATRST